MGYYKIAWSDRLTWLVFRKKDLLSGYRELLSPGCKRLGLASPSTHAHVPSLSDRNSLQFKISMFTDIKIAFATWPQEQERIRGSLLT